MLGKTACHVINLYDATGVRVGEYRFTGKSDYVKGLSVGRLTQGIYFVTISGRHAQGKPGESILVRSPVLITNSK